MDINDEYDIEKAFKAIEEELMASMIRNLKGHRAEEEKMGYNWSMWQVEMLKSLEKYKKENKKKFQSSFSNINSSIKVMISAAREAGETEQEQRILEAILKGLKAKRVSKETEGAFFRLNTPKLDALIKATTNDLTKAEHAMLRMADDQYRKVIFNAQVYANTGAGTYEQAVDMATKSFLSAGINCIEYKNGSRHSVSEYARMAIQTANKRAFLTGEGEMRKAWGLSLVIVNRRGNACPKCVPFVGKILIDDVWSGGEADGKHMLVSRAMKAGLYHPHCRDTHTTYYEGITEAEPYTKEDIKQIEEDYKKEQELKYAERQREKYGRLAKYSLDPQNREMYEARAKSWEERSARETERNTGKKVKYNEKYDYMVPVEGYEQKIKSALNSAARNVASLGSKDGYEHLQLIDLATGENIYYETNKDVSSVGGKEFWSWIKKNSGRKIAFVHNHNTDGYFSETDMRTLLSTSNIQVMVAVRNDAVIYVAEKKHGKTMINVLFDELYENELKELNRKIRDGIIMPYERAIKREEIIVNGLLRDYTKAGGLVEYDGRK
ncbi:MAG: phage minor capsid protein [Alistipes sp.]|nr:phage minor capsid protein [Alistipes sp.]